MRGKKSVELSLEEGSFGDENRTRGSSEVGRLRRVGDIEGGYSDMGLDGERLGEKVSEV